MEHKMNGTVYRPLYADQTRIRIREFAPHAHDSFLKQWKIPQYETKAISDDLSLSRLEKRTVCGNIVHPVV
jgi:hypothetical protein